MPIRFTCPHCHQKLSVGTRKAGTTADCPRCKRSLSIPEQPDSLPAPNETSPVEAPGPPAGEAAIFLPDTDQFAGIELVYDAATSQAGPKAPPAVADVIVVPRYVVYLQGGLLGLVALLALAIGMMMGSTLVAPSALMQQPFLVAGGVTYLAGPRSRPDAGAVVILLPLTPHKPEEKIPALGLRPGDPLPDADAKAIAILRSFGGAYARTDANGRFQLELPSRGRYLLLAISHNKRSGSAAETRAADLLKLNRFFENAAELLGERRYQLSQETIRPGRQFTIDFE